MIAAIGVRGGMDVVSAERPNFRPGSFFLDVRQVSGIFSIRAFLGDSR